MPEQRHVYITEGISREAFVETGVRLTTGPEGSDLDYYVHQHRYDLYGAIPCNNACVVIHEGVQRRVTQMDDANPAARA